MQHRYSCELQDMPAQVQSIAVLHGYDVVLDAVIAFEHGDSFCVADELYAGPAGFHLGDQASVVRLHVIHNEIVQLSAAECLSEFVDVLVEVRAFNGIDSCSSC